MLTIVEKSQWGNIITELKQGRLPVNNNLEEMEKRFIKRTMSRTPDDRPKDVTEVIGVIDHQIRQHAILATLG